MCLGLLIYFTNSPLIQPKILEKWEFNLFLVFVHISRVIRVFGLWSFLLTSVAAHYQTETTGNQSLQQQQLQQQEASTADDGSTASQNQTCKPGGTPAVDETKENPLIPSAPSNLLVTFLEYCSIVMQVIVKIVAC